jgi:two-component system cell cycle sensor histidine kinase/response regulator CckA
MTDEDIKINADYSKIEQVIINLVVNASHAIPNDRDGIIRVSSEKVFISKEDAKDISEYREGGFVCLSVSDNGEGIKKENLERIFDPFFTTKDVDKGTGLGLSLIYGVVKQHEGFVRVESEVGKGTTFRIFLPLVDYSDGKDFEKKNVSLLDEFQGNSEKILIVEDDESVMKLTSLLLSNRGYEIFQAKDVGEALNMLKKEKRFDLIVSDVVLPGGRSGISLVDEITSEGNGTKFLLMSGYSDDKARPDEIEKKGYPFINKPYIPRKFLEKVGDILGN